MKKISILSLKKFPKKIVHIKIGKYCTLGLILKQVQLSANELSTTEQHQFRTNLADLNWLDEHLSLL